MKANTTPQPASYTPAPMEFPILDQIIADAKAKREQEAKAHADTMAMLAMLKKGSIFSK